MRLTCTEGGSSKFWEGAVEGKNLVVRWGKIGTEGQTKTKALASAEKAEAELAKLVKEKLGKGYVADSGADSTKLEAAKKPPSKKAEAAPKKAEGDPELAARLARLTPLLKEGSEARLSKGATDAALAKLSKGIFGGGAVPDDLVAWFRWHDGQTNHSGFSPLDHRTLLSIDEALKAWKDLSGCEDVEGWSQSWLPLLENGAGDYLVYETKGPRKGSLIGYWHTDEDRKTEYASLGELAQEIEKACTEPAPAPVAEVILHGPIQLGMLVPRKNTEWKPIEVEAAQAAVPAAAPGTAYTWKQLIGEDAHVHIWIKIAPDIWFKGLNWRSAEQALADLQQWFDRPTTRPDAKHGPWRADDVGVIATLGSQVKKDGAMPHVGLRVGLLRVHGSQLPDWQG